MVRFCHIEIPSEDFEKAKEFYGDLLSREFDLIKEMDYILFKTPDGVGGGLSKNLQTSNKPVFLLYIEIEDIVTMRKGEKQGTKTLRE